MTQPDPVDLDTRLIVTTEEPFTVGSLANLLGFKPDALVRLINEEVARGEDLGSFVARAPVPRISGRIRSVRFDPIE